MTTNTPPFSDKCIHGIWRGVECADCPEEARFPAQVEGAETSTVLESLETISKFYLAVTDYFRNGQPSRLLQRVYDLGMPAARALDTMQAYVQTKKCAEPRIAAALESHQRLITEMTEEEDRCRDLLAAYDKSSPDGVVPLSEVIQAALESQRTELLKEIREAVDAIQAMRGIGTPRDARLFQIDVLAAIDRVTGRGE